MALEFLLRRPGDSGVAELSLPDDSTAVGGGTVGGMIGTDITDADVSEAAAPSEE